MMRLKKKFQEEVVPAVKKEYSLSSSMAVPRLEKIVVNMGVGKAVESGNKKLLDSAVEELSQITGQHPIRIRARKSIAAFKLREGMEVGAKVTLRGQRMWEFLERLINIALPRVRDFQGISPKSFDGKGNYNLGIQEQIIFPEIKYDKVSQIMGMDVAFVLTGNNDELSKAVLTQLGMPFKK